MNRWAASVVMTSICAGLAASLPCVAARADRPNFTRQPSFRRDGGAAEIDFTVDRTTDVAVAIEDAAGGVVRHLAAGLLGDNAPPPLRAGSLRQVLRWDGLDDRGRPAGAGPFRARVSLSLAPAFSQTYGNHPANIGRIRGLACGPDGTVYVLHCFGGHHPGDDSAAVAVFDRQGRYLRTIAPFSAALPDQKLAGLKTLRRGDGGRVPYVYQYETRSYLPGLGNLPKHRMAVTRDGRLAWVGIMEGPKCHAQPGEARLSVIFTDGAIPPAGPLHALIHPLTDSGANLALAPDERTVYAAGVRAGLHPAMPANAFTCTSCDHGSQTWRHTVPVPMVFSCGWQDEQVSVFIDGTRRQEAGAPLLVEPLDVATDAAGNVYVADFGANRIAVFDPDGKLVGAIAVPRPTRVVVHRRTGEVYVVSGDTLIDLVKFSGFADGREVSRVKIAEYRSHQPMQTPLLALDDSAHPPVLWLSAGFMRIEDLGRRFGDPINAHGLNSPATFAMGSVMELSVDRVHRLLYVNNSRRLDIVSGAWDTIAPEGGRMWPASHPGSASGTAGLDGSYYVNLGARRARLTRYDTRMTNMPFAVTHDEQGRLPGFMRNRGRGQTADHLGNIYVLWKKGGEIVDDGDFHRAHVLAKYAPDGSPLNLRLVNSQIPSVSSPRVDFQGNIYLLVGLRPGSDTVPAEIRDQVPAGSRDPVAVHGLNAYPMIYGSIVKFGPQGGSIFEKAGGRPANFAYGYPIEVAGARWIYSGASVASSWSTPKIGRVVKDGETRATLSVPGTTIVCLCEHADIDVDGFGRVFYPDAGRAQFGVLDTAGNQIVACGSYGNPDSTGLSFWWPQAVAVDRDMVFVGDRLNRRVVAARMAYRHEAVATLAGL